MLEYKFIKLIKIHIQPFESERETESKISFHCKSFAAIKKELDGENGKRRRKTNQINDAALPFANSNKMKIYNNNRS